eukprot:2617037-Pyramimonas_sp.AAC.1
MTPQCGAIARSRLRSDFSNARVHRGSGRSRLGPESAPQILHARFNQRRCPAPNITFPRHFLQGRPRSGPPECKQQSIPG